MRLWCHILTFISDSVSAWQVFVFRVCTKYTVHENINKEEVDCLENLLSCRNLDGNFSRPLMFTQLNKKTRKMRKLIPPQIGETPVFSLIERDLQAFYVVVLAYYSLMVGKKYSVLLH